LPFTNRSSPLQKTPSLHVISVFATIAGPNGVPAFVARQVSV
jgi:hypothetical protein